MIITTWLFAADSLSSKVRARRSPYVESGVVWEETVCFAVVHEILWRLALSRSCSCQITLPALLTFTQLLRHD